MNTLSTITLLPATKQELKSFSAQIISEVLGGNINPLELDARLKYVEELIKTIRKNKDIKEATYEEATKHGKTFDFANCEIRLSEKKTLKFKEDSEVERIEKELKARKEMIKLANSGQTILDPKSGEIIQPVSSTSTQIITYKLK